MEVTEIRYSKGQEMKQVIVEAVNAKEYQGSKSPVLLSMIYDDLVLLLKFIYETQKQGSLRRSFCFTNQIEYLDLFWHHFILNTRLYQEFCEAELGGFLHHEPEPNFTRDGDFSSNQADLFIEQFNLLEKNMGKEFVQRIFFVYPELMK